MRRWGRVEVRSGPLRGEEFFDNINEVQKGKERKSREQAKCYLLKERIFGQVTKGIWWMPGHE
jgi:Holliday junction resolvase-like predicted endonuclease